MVEKFMYTTGSMPAEGHQPSHPGILTVKFRAGDFQSELVAEKVSTYTLECTTFFLRVRISST
jgi:hypothetical protein